MWGRMRLESCTFSHTHLGQQPVCSGLHGERRSHQGGTHSKPHGFFSAPDQFNWSGEASAPPNLKMGVMKHWYVFAKRHWSVFFSSFSPVWDRYSLGCVQDATERPRFWRQLAQNRSRVIAGVLSVARNKRTQLLGSPLPAKNQPVPLPSSDWTRVWANLSANAIHAKHWNSLGGLKTNNEHLWYLLQSEARIAVARPLQVLQIQRCVADTVAPVPPRYPRPFGVSVFLLRGRISSRGHVAGTARWSAFPTL